MLLGEINWNPTNKELFNFGTIALIASLIIAIALYTIKGVTISWCLTVAALGLFCFLCSIISKRFTKWIYLSLTLATFPIGIAVGFILLAIFYYFLLTPIGLFFRLVRRDSLCRNFDSSVTSYWAQRRPTDNLKRYFNQF